MLKGIPECISPDLIYCMMQMGHGDELILADRDFPAHTYSQRVIRADGIALSTLLDAVLRFFPLDPFVEQPVAMMAPVGDEPESWQGFRDQVARVDPRAADFAFVERFAFYERAAHSFVVIITGEPDGNVILKKGVV